MRLFKGIMPDITPAQAIAAVFGAVFPVLTLLGVDLSPVQRDAVEQLKYLALGLLGADAAVRVGRSNALKGKIDEMRNDGVLAHTDPGSSGSLFAPTLTPEEEIEASNLEKGA